MDFAGLQAFEGGGLETEGVALPHDPELGGFHLPSRWTLPDPDDPRRVEVRPATQRAEAFRLPPCSRRAKRGAAFLLPISACDDYVMSFWVLAVVTSAAALAVIVAT